MLYLIDQYGFVLINEIQTRIRPKAWGKFFFIQAINYPLNRCLLYPAIGHFTLVIGPDGGHLVIKK